MQQPQLDFQALPEGCIATVISLTSPPDACRLSLLSKVIRSAAESDSVWDKFIPPETQITILSHPNSLSSPNFKSKKDLFMTLCDNPVLINEGTGDHGARSILFEILGDLAGKMEFGGLAGKVSQMVEGGDLKYTAFLARPEREVSEEARLPDERLIVAARMASLCKGLRSDPKGTS